MNNKISRVYANWFPLFTPFPVWYGVAGYWKCRFLSPLPDVIIKLLGDLFGIGFKWADWWYAHVSKAIRWTDLIIRSKFCSFVVLVRTCSLPIYIRDSRWNWDGRERARSQMQFIGVVLMVVNSIMFKWNVKHLMSLSILSLHWRMHFHTQLPICPLWMKHRNVTVLNL